MTDKQKLAVKLLVMGYAVSLVFCFTAGAVYAKLHYNLCIP